MLDLALTVPGTILLSPLIAGVALTVWSRLGRPVLFVQERVGMGGRLFPMIKFRTMADERDGAGFLLPDHQRLAPFGSFLRQSSLDELPQLLNVLAGQMSLVGPRPHIADNLRQCTEEQMRRHDVRPGITGLAQVRGRDRLSWEERFDLDLEYVDHGSMGLDIKILCRTLAVVLSRDGIIDESRATPREANGNETSRQEPQAADRPDGA